MSKKTVLAVCAAAVMGVGADAAFAGEVTGNGKPTQGPAHAASICAFSGQNDDPTGTQGEGPGGRVQSFGQDVKSGAIDPRQFNPGDACNPNAGGGE